MTGLPSLANPYISSDRNHRTADLGFQWNVLDFVLKKYIPQGGTLFIYVLTIMLLLWRPQGLFGKPS